MSDGPNINLYAHQAHMQSASSMIGPRMGGGGEHSGGAIDDPFHGEKKEKEVGLAVGGTAKKAIEAFGAFGRGCSPATIVSGGQMPTPPWGAGKKLPGLFNSRGG
jgi:hypothetical protein